MVLYLDTYEYRVSLLGILNFSNNFLITFTFNRGCLISSNNCSSCSVLTLVGQFSPTTDDGTHRC